MEQPAGGGRRGRRSRSMSRPWRSVLTGVVFGAVIGFPAASIASIRTINFMASSVEVNGPLVEAYDYQDGSNQEWAGSAEFDLGTLEETITDLTDVGGTPLDGLTLEPIGPDGVVAPDVTTTAWWDTDWNTRHCYELDNTDPDSDTVTEYPYRVDLDLPALIADDLIQPDFGDVRAISATGTQLPLWVDTFDDAVWVEIDTIVAGTTTTFCLYYGHDVGGQVPLPIHTEQEVFTTTTPIPAYYAIHARYAGGVDIDVASYIDGNQVSVDGAPPVTIDDGELVTLTVLPNSVISSTGAITARNRGDGYDSLVPISWTATDFVLPIERSQQRISIYAPFEDATVQVFAGAAGTPLTTVNVPVGDAVWIEPPGDPVNNIGIVIESDEKVLLFHDQSGTSNAGFRGRDAYPVAPFLDHEWFGVSSTTRYSGDTTSTHIDHYRSDSAVPIDLVANRGVYLAATGGGSQGGNAASGTYLVLDDETIDDPESSPDARFAAISQADSDGLEAVTFFPRQELNNRYLVPTNSQYIAISCPNPGTPIEVRVPGQPATSLTCTALGGSPVGWVKVTANMSVVLPAGATPGQAIEVVSTDGAPFYMYYENLSSNDETNVMGNKQFRQQIDPQPVETVTIEGLFPDEGTWLSPTVQIPLATGVYGTLDFDGNVPADTNIKVQVATGPALPPTTFVGPDGTAGTFYEFADLPLAIEFAHDGDEFIRLEVTLETTDRVFTPELESIDFDYDLPLLDRALGTPDIIDAPTVAAPADQTVYLVRLKTTSLGPGSSAVRLLDIGATGPVATRDLMLENIALGIDSTQTSGGTNGIEGPQAFGSTGPLSVLGTFALNAPSLPANGAVGGLIHVDVNLTGVWAETDITANLTATP